MKKVIRRSVFETNSSSSHSVTYRRKTDDDYEIYEKRTYKCTDNDRKIAFLISACDIAMMPLLREISNWVAKFNIKTDKNFIGWIEHNFSCQNEEELFERLKAYSDITEEVIKNTIGPYYEFSGKENRDELLQIFIDEWHIPEELMSTSIYIDWQKRIMQTYAQFLNTTAEEVQNYFDAKFGDEYPICECFFDEGPLESCNCGIEEVLWQVENEYKDIEELTLAVLNDELSIFADEWY